MVFKIYNLLPNPCEEITKSIIKKVSKPQKIKLTKHEKLVIRDELRSNIKSFSETHSFDINK